MSSAATRRSFFRRAAAAGGYLVWRGLSGTARSAQPAEQQSGELSQGGTSLVDGASGVAVNAPVTVVTELVSRDVNARAGSWVYITEILRRAGLFFEQLSLARLPSLLSHPNPIVLLAGDLQLRAREKISWANMKKQGSAAPLLFHLPVWLSSRKNTHFSFSTWTDIEPKGAALPWVQ